MKKLNISSNILLFLATFIIINSYIAAHFINRNSAYKDVTRMHVVANSNSIEDQIVKLKVYEKINDYIKSLGFEEDDNSEVIISKLKENANDIIEISNSALYENGKDYSTTLNIGKINYDTKSSILLDMPEGSYNSIKVVLGAGEGKNIWSLIFPNEENIKCLEPLNTIFPEISNIYKETEKQGESQNAKYTFKILEVLKKS